MKLSSKLVVFGCGLLLSSLVQAKEIALTFDDAPVGSTVYFETHERTNELIKKLKAKSSQCPFSDYFCESMQAR